MDFYEAELQRLDLLLHREIVRLRARYNLSLDEFRGLYVSDEQVDSLVRLSYTQAEQSQGEPDGIEVLSGQVTSLRAGNTTYLDEGHPWSRLAREFGLSATEMDALLLALAPELDAKYETLYAYLNNDVSRKWPSHSLALRLFGETESARVSLRTGLLPGGLLYGQGLLISIARSPAERQSWLTGGFAIAPAVAAFVLGLPTYHAQTISCVTRVEKLAGWHEIPVAVELGTQIAHAATFFGKEVKDTPAPMLILEGRAGTGRLAAASAFCEQTGAPLLKLDLAALRSSGEPPDAMLTSLALCARLERAGIYVEGVESLFGPDGGPLPGTHTLIEAMSRLPGPVFLACTPDVPWRELFNTRRHLYFRFTAPGYDERRKLWGDFLAGAGVCMSAVSNEELDVLAGRFDLTPGQIRAAVQATADQHRLAALVGKDNDENKDVSIHSLDEREKGESRTLLEMNGLLEAARAQSDTGLGKMAVKVASPHGWQDLVLPPATLRHAREVTAAIQHYHLVYSQWGFSRRIATGRGLKVLFAGASGTGKTMTAGVIARSLGLDLYKIDLSGLVSKYIGETEKNLDRIFGAARSGNAILFFDEADALFGKRSEVKDAHDRYANIEVSYLLQKLEEHEGAVILASNLSHNIDKAFSRRMHYVVEFPMPDATHREELWRGMFPAQAPLSPDVDFGFLARQFSIAGGDIQNAALDSAFLAASDGHVITMAHLVRAMSRQLLKAGRVPSAGEFGEYYRLVGT
jgi:hypothetical protein